MNWRAWLAEAGVVIGRRPHKPSTDRIEIFRDRSAALRRHLQFDPGLLDAHDQLQNLRALQDDTRIFSAYVLGDGTKIWIITEADRSLTPVRK